MSNDLMQCVAAEFLKTHTSDRKLESVIAEGERTLREIDWDAFRKLGISRLATEIDQWIVSANSKIEKHQEVRGILFGIQTLSDSNRAYAYDLQMDCYSSFASDDFDWADQENYVCSPTQYMAGSSVLKELFEIVQKQPKRDRYKFELVGGLALCLFALEYALNSQNKKTRSRTLGVGLCWSGGDGYVLGEMTKSGFRKNETFEPLC